MSDMRGPTKWRPWLSARLREQHALDCGNENAEARRRPGDRPLPPLAALTGQDARALAAIAACWELYASSDEDGANGALAAVRALLPAVQPHCRAFARELIAWALDWTDRDRLWPLVAGNA